MEGSGARDTGHDRQRRKAPKQRATAVGLAPDHHGRPQDHPLQVVGHQRRVAGKLAAGEGGGRAPVDANRRHLHDAPHAGLLAGSKQRSCTIGMNAGGGVSRAVLEHPGAIHHRVDADQMRQPVAGTGGLGDVERDTSSRFR